MRIKTIAAVGVTSFVGATAWRTIQNINAGQEDAKPDTDVVLSDTVFFTVLGCASIAAVNKVLLAAGFTLGNSIMDGMIYAIEKEQYK